MLHLLMPFLPTLSLSCMLACPLQRHSGQMNQSASCIAPFGLQLTLASNYFGPVYLTNLLLDVLKASAPSRIVYEASLLEQWGHVNWDDLG